MQIDLNGDVGESFGAYEIGHDAALIPILTSANIACGFHAGDPGVMRATVALAREHGTAIGAHPGFPDLVGFGRRELKATPREVEDLVAYQIGALAAIAAAQGVPLAHVKPHGALYNMAARDVDLAEAIARAIASIDSSLKLFGLPGSKSLEAAQRRNVQAVSEAFADRAYRRDGSLVPRHEPGAVIDDEAIVVSRAIAIARERMVIAADGTRVPLDVQTICVHGDTPRAAVLASRIRNALSEAGIQIRAPI
ncbi:MAG TPA: 5-oxoprolinase subunit PxpA [Vicinamibacterales bacterium]|nr:5-oxoprolinase subunit PxpA [Vicinamibacterales bacterium]